MNQDRDVNMLLPNETPKKGDTRINIPKAPITAPAAHCHAGTDMIVSSTVHADSGTESAESILVIWEQFAFRISKIVLLRAIH